MQNHTKIYFKAFGFDFEFDKPSCEICGCIANDIHHIEARGMGGNPTKSKDCIENLMAVCRKCHYKYGDLNYAKFMLYTVHKKFMQVHKATFNINKIDAFILRWTNYTN